MMNSKLTGIRRLHFLFLALIILLPVAVFAQPLLTYTVNDLEAYTRTGNWIYDADGPTFPTHDGNWFTFGGPVQWHYYAEKYVHSGITTTFTCTAENTPLASNPAEMGISFTQTNLVAFQRINTVNPALAWNIPGQSGDQRIYANAVGSITYNGTPVIQVNNATFVITTPYPTQAQIRALSPILASWTGNIGTGAAQTGYGYGDIDLDNSDPDWAALFAASNYKIDIGMLGIVSTVNPLSSIYDFTMTISPSALPRDEQNITVNTGALPQLLNFPAIDVSVNVLTGTNGGQAGDMNHISLTRFDATPDGTYPDGFPFSAPKYWLLGSTLSNFNVNLDFTPFAAKQSKAPADWRIMYRPYPTADWQLWGDYMLVDANTIRANNVSQVGQFAVVSPFDETLPVELSSFTGVMNSQYQAVLRWITSSETDMAGYKVYTNRANNLASAECLTLGIIPSTNSSLGSSYSYTATEVTDMGLHYFWLEAIGLDGGQQYFGPVTVILDSDLPPAVIVRSVLHSAYPNPFGANQPTKIEVEVKDGENGTLKIFNLTGQLVRQYNVGSGINNLTWDGRDSNGKMSGKGIYFYKLETPSYQSVKKMVRID